jgi:hypothetical protein
MLLVCVCARGVCGGVWVFDMNVCTCVILVPPFEQNKWRATSSFLLVWD